jgi:hypothetical protein
LEELHLVADRDGNARIEFQLAEGAIQARKEMFAKLGQAATASVKSLMRLASQTSRASVQALVQPDLSKLLARTGSVPEIFAHLDTDGDGLLTIEELLIDKINKPALGTAADANPASEILRQFLSEARNIMAIGQYGEEPEKLPGIILDQVLEPSDAVLSYSWAKLILPGLASESITLDSSNDSVANSRSSLKISNLVVNPLVLPNTLRRSRVP